MYMYILHQHRVMTSIHVLKTKKALNQTYRLQTNKSVRYTRKIQNIMMQANEMTKMVTLHVYNHLHVVTRNFRWTQQFLLTHVHLPVAEMFDEAEIRLDVLILDFVTESAHNSAHNKLWENRPFGWATSQYKHTQTVLSDDEDDEFASDEKLKQNMSGLYT